jgi:hypothetical protein
VSITEQAFSFPEPPTALPDGVHPKGQPLRVCHFSSRMPYSTAPIFAQEHRHAKRVSQRQRRLLGLLVGPRQWSLIVLHRVRIAATWSPAFRVSPLPRQGPKAHIRISAGQGLSQILE